MGALRPLVVPLDESGGVGAARCGNKAAALAAMIGAGLRVPGGFCVTTDAYRLCLDTGGVREQLAIELGRKDAGEMRWEEMWDASLRIRSLFTAADVPLPAAAAIEAALGRVTPGAALVVRSSSTVEDTGVASFAGLHESYVNVAGLDDVLDKVKLVWASLWSDAALAYAGELGLGVDSSAMAVIVQELVVGRVSGVAFGVDPTDPARAVVEAVPGLNKGLVDGEIEPDRWRLDRETGAVLARETAERREMIVPGERGVRRGRAGAAGSPLLGDDEVAAVFAALERVRALFGAPQDMEWTIAGGDLFLLQSRPITAGLPADDNERRAWDLGLRRSWESLGRMAARLEEELVPAMLAEADRFAERDPAELDDDELAAEIRRRGEAVERWKEIYWEEFIPFAHAVRLFGRVYNDRVRPADPFEFVDLLATGRLASVERNDALEEIAALVAGGAADDALAARVDGFLERHAGFSCEFGACEDARETILSLAGEMAGGPGRLETPGRDISGLEEAYLAAFDPGERDEASRMLDLARRSYRLRDDDNVYLGRVEAQLERALAERRRRAGDSCAADRDCVDAEETIAERIFPAGAATTGSAGGEATAAGGSVRPRQMRGQPAGAGIARGPARVVRSTADLFAVRRGEVLVCDSIDPGMTFVVPIVAAIVERRGGMLVHGAIVAREYGIPCVTGIAGAVDRIGTGDRLTVDGYLGVVFIGRGEEADPAGA